MPATQRGQAYKLAPGKWGLRYYENGVRRRKSPFPSKSAALAHYRDIIEPRLRGEPEQIPDLTLADFVELYLQRHAKIVRPRTIATLRDRLGAPDPTAKRPPDTPVPKPRHAIAAFGDVPLHDLERMSDEIAGWQAQLPPRAGHGIAQALRQVLDAAVRWERMSRNPAKIAGRNPKPPARTVRAFTFAELDAIAEELSAIYQPLPAFASATGLRPEEWQALQAGDVDRRARVLTVRRTVSSGEIVELAKTERSRRQVPLSPRALEALDRLPARLPHVLLFPAPTGGLMNIDNFRRRQWAPAVDASGVRKPARIYDMRSTFASNALAAGVTVFELARVMGTSIEMIERHYGTLLDGSGAGIAGRLAAFENQSAAAVEQR